MSRGRLQGVTAAGDRTAEFADLMVLPAVKLLPEPTPEPASPPNAMAALRRVQAREAARAAAEIQAEQDRLASLPMLASIDDLVIPDAPSLADLEAFAKTASDLWSVIDRAAIAPKPDAPAPDPEASGLVVRDVNGNYDVAAMSEAAIQYARQLRAKPRYVAPPKPSAGRTLGGPARSLAKLLLAIEDVRSLAADVRGKLDHYADELREECRRYNLEVDQSLADFAASKKADADEKIRSETARVAEVVRSEEERQAMLAAHKAGVR